MFIRFLIFSLLILCLPHTALSQDMKTSSLYDFMIDNRPLTNQELETAFKGKTHKGFYRFERETLPTHRFSETTFADGRVIHTQDTETIRGVWRIKNNQMCYRYEDIWTQELCFDMYRIGTCYYHYIRSSGGRPTSGWTARSTPEKETPTCDAQIS